MRLQSTSPINFVAKGIFYLPLAFHKNLNPTISVNLHYLHAPAVFHGNTGLNDLEDAFNDLINSFVDSEVGIAQNFLSEQLTSQLTANLLSHYSLKRMLSAGTGNSAQVNQDKKIRSDVIYWLDRKHQDPCENDFFDVIDRFAGYLNRTCYTGITGYEFHYTLYETGSFYKKHLDQFKNDGSRKYSMVIYLNVGWQPSDGGELCIYHLDHEQNISPSSGKSIFFKSNELEHEVRITHKPRMSITGWFKADANDRVLQ